ncbi:50S ribosomal protein L24 [Hippea maritima]|uniref:Large ribosomal subunit protein uL24 n=1 Tax=Hippea maritima (strain ATCC 700847 / DSM 10411 / MH2) TaxID=760142 RepID=F2LXT1_HIPMA|nr:50S ribosomal protein L24 [Hippea maritima]AEA34322.1 ribosomal protein L24 [Hippea maritima DSM 10411]
MKRIRTRLKKSDKVKVIAGKDKGKEGNVISFVPEKDRVIVEGVNVIKKHVKASETTKGGIVEKEAPIHISNVMLVCPHCNKPTRIGVKFLESGEKVRYCKKCGETI